MWIKTKSNAEGTAIKWVRSTDMRLIEIRDGAIWCEMPLSQFTIEVKKIPIYVPDAFEELEEVQRQQKQQAQLHAAVTYINECLDYKRNHCDMTSFTKEDYGADAISQDWKGGL